MKKFKLIIFDLDGTIADTSRGIINCHKHANAMMGNKIEDEKMLASVIGGPLLNTYRTKFGYSEADARLAVDIYRERYATEGFKEAVLYPEMEKTLIALKERGYRLAVATLKAEKFAIPMLKELRVGDLFDVIHGVDDKDTHTKSSLIDLCIKELECTKEESVLVGDSIHDARGAMESGIDFIAATYGFGFKSDGELTSVSPYAVIDSPANLNEIL
ncbi:MAG: HAD hydrolase-like protein [Clostridia bacterium]|nr:HAD hydrolase-like protein [Clostridia bacterium]